jgi:hypothetical protein
MVSHTFRSCPHKISLSSQSHHERFNITYSLLVVAKPMPSEFPTSSALDCNRTSLIHCIIVLANIRLGVLMKKTNVAFPDYLILYTYYQLIAYY